MVGLLIIAEIHWISNMVIKYEKTGVVGSDVVLGLIILKYMRIFETFSKYSLCSFWNSHTFALASNKNGGQNKAIFERFT